MSVWGANVWGANVWGANVWADAVEASVYGRVPKKKQERRYLITIRGERFQVPESELDYWLAKQEEALAQETLEKPAKVVRKGKKQAVVVKQPEAPKIVAKTDDMWLRNLVADANRRVQEQVAQRRAEMIAHQRMLDDDDEDVLTLLL